MSRHVPHVSRGVTGLVCLACAAGWLSAPARAERITPGSKYWQLLQKLETQRSELSRLEDACQQLRDIEETVSLAEEVARPVLPGLEQAANSRVFQSLGDLPYIGDAAKCVRLCLTTVHAGMKTLAWAHELDAQMIRPLTDAVLASNALLRSKDDRDVPQVISFYQAALLCLQKWESNLSANITQTQNMVRLTDQVLKLVRRYKRDDTDLISALTQYRDALSKVLIGLRLTQVKVKGAIAFVQDVLSAVPREVAVPTPAAGPTETTQVDDWTQPGVETSVTQQPLEPTGSGPAPGATATPAAEPPAPAEAGPVAPARAQNTPSRGGAGPPASGKASSADGGNTTRDKVVFVGGVAALGTGLGALAYVIVQALGVAGLPLRRP